MFRISQWFSPAIESFDFETLTTDREAFEAFIYTPLDRALEELKSRRSDKKLEKRVSELLRKNIPEPLKDSPKAVIFRQLATPNYEMRRFFSLIDSINELDPLCWEYYEDKFTSNNEWKHALGKLFFYFGVGKKSGAKIESLNVIDFNTYNGHKISEVKTLWDESLIEFHHNFLSSQFKDYCYSFFDASTWFSQQGGDAAHYYKNFLTLFVRHGILFENFMFGGKEYEFTREVFLPAFIEIYKKTGVKPLIVALEPTDIEHEKFWMCHPGEHKGYVLEKLTVPGTTEAVS